MHKAHLNLGKSTQHPFRNQINSSFRVKLCLQVYIASHQKLTPKKTKVYGHWEVFVCKTFKFKNAILKIAFWAKPI